MTKYYVNVNEDGIHWYKDPEMKIRHQIGGPAVECSNGDKFWYIDGNIDRLDYPAVEWANGDKEWWVDDKLHREDGPAVEYPNGDIEYWLNGEQMTKQQWEAGLRPVEELTVGQIEQLLGKKIKIIK